MMAGLNIKVILIALIGALTLSGLGVWRGYAWGYAASEAQHNADRLAQISAGQELEAERREVARERDELAQQLEVEAYEEPVVVQQCLGPSRLRRLNAIGQ